MFFRRAALAFALAVPAISSPAYAAGHLEVTYPPTSYETTSESIFVIGTAPPGQPVTVNGKAVDRSPGGNFGPSFGLHLGENTLVVRCGGETITLHIVRRSAEPTPPRGASFAAGSLAPAVDLARQPGEPIWLEAVAPPGARVTARVAGRDIPLSPRPATIELPDNKAALVQKNEPTAVSSVRYQASVVLHTPGRYGKPVYRVEVGSQRSQATAPGAIEIMDPTRYEVAQVTVDGGVARTGPSTDYSRLTPLPKGTQALVTGRDGGWLRLDYGAWLDGTQARELALPAPPRTLIRSIGAKRHDPWTEIAFPLQAPVPVAVSEGEGTFTLTLFGATAQTDIIHLDRDPLIDWLGFTQTSPDRIDYTFHLKRPHPWGYKLAYDGTTLRLALRHAPTPNANPLAGVRIVLDPGHGGADDPGTTGPDGTHEKDLTLAVGLLVRDRLKALGADVVMTRERDASVGLVERQEAITRAEPTLSVSLHYNALPDNGDVLHTQGVGGFWYNPQSQPFAAFMQKYLVEQLGRPSYGLFWDNLALTRPTIAPCILIELAFLSSPYESEWAADPAQQRMLATAIANGLAAYVREGAREP